MVSTIGMEPESVPARSDSILDPGEPLRFAVGECSLGAVLVAASEKGVCAILLGDAPGALRRDLKGRFPGVRLIDGTRVSSGWRPRSWA
jgi:AraC family transcriptional regulator, regulatory protein of adaptative response / methylated-DNA-[protein]-cysteine methyltransferase